MEFQTLAVLAVIFLATFVGSTFGFGLGLIAMPLLAFLVDIKTATPLVSIVGTSTAFFILVKNWRTVNIAHIWRLIIPSLAGIPVGLYFLKGTDDGIMKIVLALMIILFALFSLLNRITYTLKAQWPAYFVGFFSGIIGSAYNMGGPPVIIFGTLKKWSPATFRATLQGYFLPVCIFISSSHYLAGLITAPVVHYYTLGFPILVLNIIIGGKINRSLPTQRFNLYIYIMLLIIGSVLLINTII